MRRFFVIVIAFLAILAGAVFAVPYLIPAGTYKSTIEQEAGKATGKQLVIDGDLHFTIYPVLGLTANQVRLNNPATAPGGVDFVRMDSLAAGVKLWPLLSGRVEITHVTLAKPVIRLVVDAKGNRNWITNGTQTTSGGSAASSASADAARFDGLTIQDGTLTYDDAQDGFTRTLEHINLEAGVTSLKEPVTLNGDAVLRGDKMSITGRINSLHDFQTGLPTPVDMSLTAPLLQASFKGTLARHASEGAIKLLTPNLDQLEAWASKPGKATGLGRLSLEGMVKVDGLTERFSDLRLSLAGSTITGTLAINHTGNLPLISGALSVDTLNLNRFMGKGATEDAADQSPTAGWSRKPINLAVLDTANADLMLTIGSVRMRKLKFGRTAMEVHIKSGVLNARLDPVELYGGTGRMSVTVNGDAGRYASTLRIGNVAAMPFLSDAVGVNRIEGAVSLTYNVAGSGHSSNAIMHSLDGTGQIAFANGRIHGVDLAHIAGEISKLVGKASLSGNDSDSTVFTAMGGSFTIARGIATNRDFHMESPFIRVTGAGNLDVGERTLDYVVKPKAVASLSGQGGSRNAAGITVPFRIHGPWGHLSYTPDLSGLAAGLLDSISSGGLSTKSLLNGLLGGGQPDQRQDPNAPKKKNAKPIDVLRGLFGGH